MTQGREAPERGATEIAGLAHAAMMEGCGALATGQSAAAAAERAVTAVGAEAVVAAAAGGAGVSGARRPIPALTYQGRQLTMQAAVRDYAAALEDVQSALVHTADSARRLLAPLTEEQRQGRRPPTNTTERQLLAQAARATATLLGQDLHQALLSSQARANLLLIPIGSDHESRLAQVSNLVHLPRPDDADMKGLIDRCGDEAAFPPIELQDVVSDGSNLEALTRDGIQLMAALPRWHSSLVAAIDSFLRVQATQAHQRSRPGAAATAGNGRLHEQRLFDEADIRSTVTAIAQAQVILHTWASLAHGVGVVTTRSVQRTLTDE